MRSSEQATVLGLVLGALLAAAGPCLAGPGGRDTDWFKEGRYGAFMHFLPADPKGLALVESFDVEALARQLEAIGAKHFVITLGQNSGFFVSPNAAYDRRTGYAPGERCSRRDLPLDIHGALAPRGIRLMLYLPGQTPNGDRRAQKADASGQRLYGRVHRAGAPGGFVHGGGAQPREGLDQLPVGPGEPGYHVSHSATPFPET